MQNVLGVFSIWRSRSPVGPGPKENSSGGIFMSNIGSPCLSYVLRISFTSNSLLRMLSCLCNMLRNHVEPEACKNSSYLIIAWISVTKDMTPVYNQDN